ncbi:MAG: 3'-5' exonuclease [Bacillota bacterium]
MSDDRLFYEADCRRLNRKATLTSPGANLTHVEKLFDRVFPPNHKAPPLQPDLPVFKELAAAITAAKHQINWDQDLSNASFAVFDTETTGLHPFKGDEVIAFGAVLIEEGRLLEPAFQRLVNPLRPISAQSKRITGISEEMLRDQPTICSVLLDFLKFVGPRILVAHNASFDLAFLNLKIGEAIGTRVVNPVIDTVLLTAALYPNCEDYTLEGLAPRFNLNLAGRHSALGDAMITAALFLQLLPRLLEAGVNTLHQLAQLFSDSEQKGGFPLIF